MQVFLVLRMYCHGTLSRETCIIPLNYPMTLMYLPVAFWFCHWPACQQANSVYIKLLWRCGTPFLFYQSWQRTGKITSSASCSASAKKRRFGGRLQALHATDISDGTASLHNEQGFDWTPKQVAFHRVPNIWLLGTTNTHSPELAKPPGLRNKQRRMQKTQVTNMDPREMSECERKAER